MDFGVLDGLICSENTNNSLFPGFDLDPKLFKQEKSPSVAVSGSANQDEQRMVQIDFSNRMLLKEQRSDTSSQNMLSFSSPNTQHNLMFPYCAPTDSGYGRIVAGVRGPFSVSQWVELEHQALIFKYITINAPIPSNLLIPIRKALETAAFSSYPNLRHYGWGGFHLGFSNRSDPEPGRCRRTDGKKWRCSRDAVADQKYCERHMNRGRHRSRKPVEGQSQTTNNVITHLHQQSSHQLRGNMSSEKTQDSTCHSVSSPSMISPKRNTVSEFGFVLSDSLLNPLQDNNNGSQNQFMDDWQDTDKTQLSISSNSSQIRERINIFGERSQLNLMPLSVEASMGGPLGEVLNHSTNSSSR